MRFPEKWIVTAGWIILVTVWLPSGRAQRAEFEDPRRGRFNRIPDPPRDIFPGDKFTFCRIRYTSDMSRSGGPWYTDYPDSDENFSTRLAEMTTIEVDPHHVVVDLTDDVIFKYPILYMLEVGTLEFKDEEVEMLREYLLRGGFLLVDDFWGKEEWRNWEEQISRVFPPEEYPMVDIPLSHEIFHCVFEIKEVPQIPSIYIWMNTGSSTERADAPYAESKGIFDKHNRLMVVVMHNTDLGDGWEREGENEEYFNRFSAKKAYPMGINIITYAMTH
ncbi:DUF4159 domain-containing protein [Candidatus Sumerlaeota bacterium]|nr:DUF4159 domain-containing protein [Candidatus Sumerlaeota bacterium]